MFCFGVCVEVCMQHSVNKSQQSCPSNNFAENRAFLNPIIHLKKPHNASLFLNYVNFVWVVLRESIVFVLQMYLQNLLWSDSIIVQITAFSSLQWIFINMVLECSILHQHQHLLVNVKFVLHKVCLCKFESSLAFFSWCFLNRLLRHMAQMLVLGFDCWMEKPYYRWKTPLVVGGTWTHVLADSIAIVPPRH